MFKRGFGMLAACAVVAGCGDDAAKGPEPVLTMVSAPATATYGDAVQVTLGYRDRDADISSLEVVRHTALGTTELAIAAARLGIAGTDGEVSTTLSTIELPFGDASYQLVLVDAAGHRSAEVAYTLAVVGTGAGTPPRIETLAVTPAALVRPTGDGAEVTAQATLRFTDLDGDIMFAHVRVGEDPPRQIAAWDLGIADTTGEITFPLRSFVPADPIASYPVSIVLFDHAGAASEAASGTIALVETGGEVGPAISAISPTSGPAGTLVTISGSGFTSETLVVLSARVATIESVSATQLEVRVPDDANTSRFDLANAIGHARSDVFTVPAAVTIEADDTTVAFGGQLALIARTVSSSSRVEWLVNDQLGGSAALGTIDATGRFTAPVESATGSVQITARLVDDPTVRADIAARLVPTRAGSTTPIIAAAGGSARSEDARALVAIPPGALATDTPITVSLPEAPVPLAGRMVLGAVELGPTGTVFAAPVTVTIPLASYRAPGEELVMRHYLGGGAYATDTTLAVVTSDGTQAVGTATHFSTYVLDAPIFAAPNGNPLISTMTPASAREGERVVVEFTGANLSPDLTVRVLRDGQPTTDLVAGTLFVRGDQAGVVIDIGVLPDLGEGETRSYTLELAPRLGPSATASFAVDGLPELVIDTPVQLTDESAGTFSEILITAPVRIASGSFDVTATRRIIVTAPIDGDGDAGTAANGTQAGLGSTNAGAGGGGRIDALPNGRPPAPGYDHGKNGRPCIGPFAECEIITSSNLRGIGGAPGIDTNLFGELLDFLGSIVSCVLSPGLGCIEIIIDLVDLVREIEADIDNADHGRAGHGAIPGGGGGGGGGGGYSSGVFDGDPGGGGGGGGGPGRVIKLQTPLEMTLAAPVTARGGNGGNGSNAGSSPGGGGGGGGGGSLAILAGGQIARNPNTTVSAAGGVGGIGGLVDTDEHSYAFRSGHGGYGQKGALSISDSYIEPGRTLARVESHVRQGTLLVVPVSSRTPTTAAIQVVGSTGERIVRPTDTGAGLVANLLLFDGRNTIIPGNIISGTFSPSVPAMFYRTVLVLANDTDGDGLADADETALGGDPTRADTDGDGLLDGFEIQVGSDIALPDSDNDGLGDGREVELATNPAAVDSDGDGARDGVEVVLGTNPRDPQSVPAAIPAGTLIAGRGADLALLHPVTGDIGIIGNAGGLAAIGVAQHGATLFASRLVELASVDPSTATATFVGSFGNGIRATQLVSDGTQLFAVERGAGPTFDPTGQLLSIDPTTGIATRIGAAGSVAIHGLAIDASGRLFATLASSGSGNDQLAILGKTTGGATVIGTTGASGIFGLAFATTGALLGTTDTAFVRIDLVTAATTTVAPLVHPIQALTVSQGGGGGGAGTAGGYVALSIQGDSNEASFQTAIGMSEADVTASMQFYENIASAGGLAVGTCGGVVPVVFNPPMPPGADLGPQVLIRDTSAIYATLAVGIAPRVYQTSGQGVPASPMFGHAVGPSMVNAPAMITPLTPPPMLIVPSVVPQLATPAAGATVVRGQPLTVTWTPPAGADSMVIYNIGGPLCHVDPAAGSFVVPGTATASWQNNSVFIAATNKRAVSMMIDGVARDVLGYVLAFDFVTIALSSGP